METFQQYSARLLSLSAGKDALTVLGSTALRIGELIAGRSAESLRQSPSRDQWSIAQIIAHLADAEIVAAYRFRVILAAPAAPLQGISPALRPHPNRLNVERCSECRSAPCGRCSPPFSFSAAAGFAVPRRISSIPIVQESPTAAR